MKRSLVLRRENLSEITPAELSDVAGGASQPVSCYCPDNTYYCITGPAMCRESRIVCA
jgi:hypothetical protein